MLNGQLYTFGQRPQGCKIPFPSCHGSAVEQNFSGAKHVRKPRNGVAVTLDIQLTCSARDGAEVARTATNQMPGMQQSFSRPATDSLRPSLLFGESLHPHTAKQAMLAAFYCKGRHLTMQIWLKTVLLPGNPILPC